FSWGFLGSLGLSSGSLLGSSLLSCFLGFLLLAGLLLLFGDGLSGRTVVGLGESLVEQVELGWLLLGDTQGALGALEALELLPVTGHLEQCSNRLGWLSANGETVLGALGVDLDDGWFLFWLVDADVIDALTVALGACVSCANAVVRCTDLTETLVLDLDSHVCSSRGHWAVQTPTSCW